MQKKSNEIKRQTVRPHEEKFKKIQSDRAVGIMKHSNGTIEKRKF